jgi:predicted nucleic acid-binding protein
MPTQFNKRVYWDTCIFLAWLKNEDRPDPREMDGIAECVANAEKRETLIVTGQCTKIELMPLALDVKAQTELNRLFQRRCVQYLPGDPRLDQLAEKIRTHYAMNRDGGKLIGSMDALHLANAIHYRVDEFYTFDKGKRGDRGLLGLNGNVAGYPLVICKPPVTQFRLFPAT